MLAALVLAVALPAIARAAPAASRPLAVVIGSNESPTPALERLRYADDDAIQNARMLSLLGVRPQLLVTPDAETRELFASVQADGRATRAAVVAAFDCSAALARQARARGQATSLYIFVAAHGDVEGDRAFLQLEDGRLWRDDLAELARRVGADQTHVVIDACQASLFVGSRGPGGDRFPLGFGLLPRGPRAQLAAAHRLPHRPLVGRPDPRMDGVPGGHLLARGAVGPAGRAPTSIATGG